MTSSRGSSALSALRPQELTLKLMTVTSLFPDMAGNIPFLKRDWFAGPLGLWWIWLACFHTSDFPLVSLSSHCTLGISIWYFQSNDTAYGLWTWSVKRSAPPLQILNLVLSELVHRTVWWCWGVTGSRTQTRLLVPPFLPGHLGKWKDLSESPCPHL